MTEKELVTAAQIFQANCGMNKIKISFSDSCKVVLLSRLVDQGREFTSGELNLLLRLIQGKGRWRYNWWYKFW